jgi:DoxX-like family
MRIVRRVSVIVLWLLQILMAAAFVLIGVAKVADPAWTRNFARWGYPDGFYMVIGACMRQSRVSGRSGRCGAC